MFTFNNKQSTDFLLDPIGWICVYVTRDFIAICVSSLYGSLRSTDISKIVDKEINYQPT